MITIWHQNVIARMFGQKTNIRKVSFLGIFCFLFLFGRSIMISKQVDRKRAGETIKSMEMWNCLFNDYLMEHIMLAAFTVSCLISGFSDMTKIDQHQQFANSLCCLLFLFLSANNKVRTADFGPKSKQQKRKPEHLSTCWLPPL